MATRFDLGAFAYAHRGLWGNALGPENSLAAFRAASEAGLGIEFDLRPAADGTPMIFHDSLLDRMTTEGGVFESRTATVLRTINLVQSTERIPTFDDLLGFWPASLPLLCEMKIDGTTDPLGFASTIAARLATWPGRAAAMSFSEAAVRALPDTMMRGQLVLPSSQAGEAAFAAVIERAAADRIDYLAVHHSDTARAAPLARAAGLPFVVWTIRNEADLSAVRPYKPAIIFEHIDPALAAP